VDADADGLGFHVALSDHEHGVDFHLFGALNRRAPPINTHPQFGWTFKSKFSNLTMQCSMDRLFSDGFTEK